MKNRKFQKEIIEKLRQYPDDAEVGVAYYWQDRYGNVEAGHAGEFEVVHDPDNNEIYIEGHIGDPNRKIGIE